MLITEKDPNNPFVRARSNNTIVVVGNRKKNNWMHRNSTGRPRRGRTVRGHCHSLVIRAISNLNVRPDIKSQTHFVDLRDSKDVIAM
jgi:hypothetical protein